MSPILKTITGRRRTLMAAISALAVLAAAIMGCTEPVTVYHVPGEAVASGNRVLVLPFMDTRTFIADNDPHKTDLGTHARNIFVEAMRENGSGRDSVILTPNLPVPGKSLTNAEVAELGRRNGADVVVAGQVFSFTDTRAASIPARAGMFIRVISAGDGSLLFVGDHYQAAAVPGVGGGRDMQAKYVSVRLVEGFLRQAEPVAAAVGRVASATALAALAPAPIRMPLANKTGGAGKTGDNESRPEPLPFPGIVGGNLLNPSEWDDQVVPEVPPLFDLDGDVGQPPASVSARTEPDNPVEPERTGTDAAAVESRQDAADTTGDSESGLPAQDDAAQTPVQQSPADAEEEAPEAPGATGDESVWESALAPAGEDELPEAPGMTDAEAEPVQPPIRTAATDTVFATEIDELPELALEAVDSSIGREDRELIEMGEASNLSGDDLASDLFESEGDIWPDDGSEALSVTPTEFADAPTTGTPEAAAEWHDAVAVDEVTDQAMAEALRAANASAREWRPIELDLDTLEAKGPPAAPASRVEAPAPRQASPAARTARPEARPVPTARRGNAPADDNGPLVSTPIAVEQPRTLKMVDTVELAADPAAVRQEQDALVAVPAAPATPGAIRLLILPYHDRPNPNNLIANTGGGEVVTTLYGTQLALDSRIQLMWDGSGQATHDRLITREDAIQMGKQAGADFVVRGQVVEFRRAQSVPSFYSAVISTAVLAAQVFFAEMSGVDVATEVYRVSDGLCVMSRRDRAQQKYVVQAEKTVRRMAAGMADSVLKTVKTGNPEEMDPLIDELSPLTLLSNPK